MNWIRKKLRTWLGIERNEEDIETLDRLYSDLTSIGVDVHFKSPHMILIFTKLGGGQIHHIDANFQDLKELNDFVRWLKEKYRPREVYWDLPPHLRNWIDE